MHVVALGKTFEESRVAVHEYGQLQPTIGQQELVKSIQRRVSNIAVSHHC